MTAEALGLGGVSVLVLGASLGVVLARNLFHAVLWLALALVGTAGLLVLLHAEFLAAVQVLLYAGGVVTIVVFAIMLTERLVGDSSSQTNRGIVGGAVVAAAVFIGVAGTILRAPRLAVRRRPTSLRGSAGWCSRSGSSRSRCSGSSWSLRSSGRSTSPARRSERAERVLPARGGACSRSACSGS